MRKLARIFGHLRFHQKRLNCLHMEMGFALMDICDPPPAIGEEGFMRRALGESGRFDPLWQRKEGEESATLRI